MVEVEIGRDGLVRTVIVIMRNMHKGAKEHLRECKAGVTRMRLPVQRIVLILPGRDQPQVIIEELRNAWSREERIDHQETGELRLRQAEEGEEIMDLV